jgi:hypothetical protein
MVTSYTKLLEAELYINNLFFTAWVPAYLKEKVYSKFASNVETGYNEIVAIRNTPFFAILKF